MATVLRIVLKALEYMSVVSERFASLEHARDSMGRFVQAYNTAHRDSGLDYQTLADEHFEVTEHVDDQRLDALVVAWAEHPERFGKNWLPKKKLLPQATRINESLKQEGGKKMAV